MNGQRKALIIASDEYEHEGLRHLLAPAADAASLARVLGDPQIGDFAVRVVHNMPAHIVQVQIEDFLAESRPDDLLLLHFSCHGLKSESGDLFLAARDTRPNRLGSTAISADFVQRCMRASRSRSIVLLLDCCYGGAFSQGVTVRAAGDVNVLDSFSGRKLGNGHGRAVITASNAMEYAFEGEQLADDHGPRPSVFTQALVDGLATGDADRDEDGWISLNELYDYVFDKVREQNPHQTPSRDVEMQGELYLARSRRKRIRAAPLPPDLEAARRDQNMYTRRGAVNELRSRLLGDNLPAAAGAWEALTELTNDIEYVADEARAALREAAVQTAESELYFGRLVQGSPPPHRTVHLLGPPIARACRPDTSHAWTHVRETADGFDISVDTFQVAPLEGRLLIKGPTGKVTVAIHAEVLPAPASPPVFSAVPESIPAPLATSKSRPTAPPSPPPRPSFSPRPSVPSPRPAVSGPTPPASPPKPGHGRSILSVLWALLPVLPFGLLIVELVPPILIPIFVAIPFVHAAVRLRSRRLWVISAAYGFTALTLWTLWMIAMSEFWVTAGYILLFFSFTVSVFAAIHAFILRPRVFTRTL